jgi:hypothetical protein
VKHQRLQTVFWRMVPQWCSTIAPGDRVDPSPADADEPPGLEFAAALGSDATTRRHCPPGRSMTFASSRNGWTSHVATSAPAPMAVTAQPAGGTMRVALRVWLS